MTSREPTGENVTHSLTEGVMYHGAFEFDKARVKDRQLGPALPATTKWKNVLARMPFSDQDHSWVISPSLRLSEI